MPLKFNQVKFIMFTNSSQGINYQKPDVLESLINYNMQGLPVVLQILIE